MKAFILHSFFCFVAVCATAQKPIVFLEIDPKEAEIGEVITITVKSNVQGEIDIDFPSAFVHGFNVMNGMEQEIDYTTGKVISYYYLSQTGTLQKSGTFKMGPAYVKKGNKVYRSNAVSITISKENEPINSGIELTSKQLKLPAFGIIEKSKSVIYEGESVVLNAKVYAQFDASHLENYEGYYLDGAIDKHSIGNTTQIVVEEEKIKRKSYFSFVYDKKVVFPNGIGMLSINPFKLTLRRGFESFPLISSTETIEVKPLPKNAPKNFIGGVGQFTITRNLSSKPTKQGDVFTLILEIEGFGNIQNILEPKLNLPKGFILYGDPIVEEDFVYGSRGAEGKISYEYNIQVTRHGELTFPETTIAYFDPTKEKYIQISSEKNAFIISKNGKFSGIVNDSTLPSNKEKKLVSSSIPMGTSSQSKSTDFLQSTLFWFSITSPILLLFFLGLFWKKKSQNNAASELKNTQKNTQKEIHQVFKEAENALLQKNWNNYYSLIEKGLLIAVVLFLDTNEFSLLNKNEILAKLQENKLEPEKIETIESLFNRCEEARYGMGSNALAPEKILASAKEIVSAILNDSF